MNDFVPSLQDKGVKLIIEDGVADLIAKEAENGVRGARDIRHTIRRRVEDPLTDLLVSSYDKKLTSVIVAAKDGTITVTPSFE